MSGEPIQPATTLSIRGGHALVPGGDRHAPAAADIAPIQDMLTLYPFEDRHLDAVMQAYEQIGIRVIFSLQYADRKGLETIPYWKDMFPNELHALLSTAAEPERQLDLLGHFETA